MTIYGWYSDEAFKMNKIGYLYSDFYNNSKLCTIVSEEDMCPYYQPLNMFKENVIFQGELKELICPIHYKNINEKDIRKITEKLIDSYNTYDILKRCEKNRDKRFIKLRSPTIE
jgi:hypothetical protein